MACQCFDEVLLAHPGASKALHETWGWMVYCVGGKQFACEFTASPRAKAPYAGRHLLSLKCDPDRILALRVQRRRMRAVICSRSNAIPTAF